MGLEKELAVHSPTESADIHCTRYLSFISDTQVPTCLLCGTFLDYIHETNFWMSSGGTRSVIHYDADHNLHCLVAGRKDFIMIEKQYYNDLYFLEKVVGQVNGMDLTHTLK